MSDNASIDSRNDESDYVSLNDSIQSVVTADETSESLLVTSVEGIQIDNAAAIETRGDNGETNTVSGSTPGVTRQVNAQPSLETSGIVMGVVRGAFDHYNRLDDSSESSDCVRANFELSTETSEQDDFGVHSSYDGIENSDFSIVDGERSMSSSAIELSRAGDHVASVVHSQPYERLSSVQPSAEQPSAEPSSEQQPGQQPSSEQPSAQSAPGEVSSEQSSAVPSTELSAERPSGEQSSSEGHAIGSHVVSLPDRTLQPSVHSLLGDSGYLLPRIESPGEVSNQDQDQEADDEAHSDLERTPRPAPQSLDFSGLVERYSQPGAEMMKSIVDMPNQWRLLLNIMSQLGAPISAPNEASMLYRRLTEDIRYEGTDIDEATFLESKVRVFFTDDLWQQVLNKVGGREYLKFTNVHHAIDTMASRLKLLRIREAVLGIGFYSSPFATDLQNIDLISHSPHMAELFTYFEEDVEEFNRCFDQGPEEFGPYLKRYTKQASPLARSRKRMRREDYKFSTPDHDDLPADVIEYVREAKRRKGCCRRCWGSAHPYRLCPAGPLNTPTWKRWSIRFENYSEYD